MRASTLSVSQSQTGDIADVCLTGKSLLCIALHRQSQLSSMTPPIQPVTLQGGLAVVVATLIEPRVDLHCSPTTDPDGLKVNDDVVRARIPAGIKKRARVVHHKIGMTESDAFRMIMTESDAFRMRCIASSPRSSFRLRRAQPDDD